MSSELNLSTADPVITASTEPDVKPADRRWEPLVEFITVIGWTVAADLFIFRASGYLAICLFFAVALAALLIMHRLRCAPSGQLATRQLPAWISGALLLLATARLAWAGSIPLSLATAFTFVCLALALSGWLPTLPRVLTAIAFTPLFGVGRLHQLQEKFTTQGILPSRSIWLSILFPIIAVGLFGGIFVLANPDLVQQVLDWSSQFSKSVVDFFSDVSFWELPFVVFAFFVGCGLLRPFIPTAKDKIMRLLGTTTPNDPQVELVASAQAAHAFYAPARNTLLALIGLFLAYLVFEFRTLWREEFPEGFYYAGYAHEGAAWLTVALALATLVLSIVFHKAMFDDQRVHRLKTLAWIWSALNLLLAIAVYNRLWIYVGYNGLTEMRMVGFFGITLVLVGFVLVIHKILHQRSFIWLVQSQLIAFSLAIVLYCLFPVDYVAHRYNASRVTAGYLHPSVMIAVKPIDDEGVFPLLNLVDHPDETIREGVRALLAERQRTIESYSHDIPWHWHRFQYSKTLLYQHLKAKKSKWSSYSNNPAAGKSAISKFRDYAMQWY